MNRRNDGLGALIWLFFAVFLTCLACTVLVGWRAGWWL